MITTWSCTTRPHRTSCGNSPLLMDRVDQCHVVTHCQIPPCLHHSLPCVSYCYHFEPTSLLACQFSPAPYWWHGVSLYRALIRSCKQVRGLPLGAKSVHPPFFFACYYCCTVCAMAVVSEAKTHNRWLTITFFIT